MKDKPLVSLIVNNYNYERFLGNAIDSALQQTYSPLEVIVVDDGSQDNSRELIASYGDRVIPIFKPNGGQASAFNAGFAASRGDIICFLDADDLFLPEKVAVVVEVLGDREELGWCFHPLEFTDTEKVDIQEVTSRKEGDRSHTVQEYDLRSQFRRGKPLKGFPYPSTSGLCFRRSLLRSILPMPERPGGTLLNDGYLIFIGLGISKGITVDRQLGIYRLHGDNAHGITQVEGSNNYTIKKDKQRYRAKLLVILAYWIGVKFPELSKIANYLTAAGLGIAARHGGIEPEYREFVRGRRSAATLLEKLEIYARAVYVYLKNPQD